MSMRFHVWIGNPRSLSELSTLEVALRRLAPPAEDDLRVVFEDRLLDITDLAGGFTRSDDVKNELAARASQFGLSEATAMFGAKAAGDLSGKNWPHSLRYLGSFTLEDLLDSETEGRDWHISLYESVLNGDIEAVRQFLDVDPDSVHEINEVGHTPLMASATTERPDIMELLLNAGALVTDLTPENGYNALHWALHHPTRDQDNVLRAVKLLVGVGADVNASALNGTTPLMLAAWFGAHSAVEFLLKRGAKRDAKDAGGKTARDMALQRGHRQILELLSK
jgi:hypothetical protein